MLLQLALLPPLGHKKATVNTLALQLLDPQGYRGYFMTFFLYYEGHGFNKC